MTIADMNKKFINEINNKIYISSEILESINSMDIENDIIDSCFAKFIGKLPSGLLGYEYMKLATNINILEDNEIDRILFVGNAYACHAKLVTNLLDKNKMHWYYLLQEKLNEFKKKHNLIK